MEDKKSIKISLGTVICLFIIFILIVALVGMYFYYNYFRKIDEDAKTENIVVSDSKIDNIDNNKNEEGNTLSNETTKEKSNQNNENINKTEETTNDFVKSFGNVYSQIYVKGDNTIFFYNNTTKKYIQIKDENSNIVKMKDAFVQWSSIHNDLVNETRWRRKTIYCY